MAGEFSKAGQKIINGAMIGMYKTSRKILSNSLYITPIETGTLRRSVSIEPAIFTGESVRIRFGYGYGDEINEETRRPAADYAVPVHEILEKKHKPPTQAKFLEQPVLEHAPQMGPEMDASITMVLKEGEINTYQIITGGTPADILLSDMKP